MTDESDFEGVGWSDVSDPRSFAKAHKNRTMTDESEFEGVGWSDVEVEGVDGADTEKEEPNTQVVIEFSRDQLETTSHESKKLEARSVNQSFSDLSSFVSVQQISNMNAIQSADAMSQEKQEGYSKIGSSDAVSDFSQVESSRSVRSLFSSWNLDAAESVAASSTITGFDVLSLNGTTHRRCKNCTFLNAEDAPFCESCELALVSNPCLEIDAQIAKHLQLRDIENAERRQKLFQQETLFVQANILSEEIERAVSPFHSQGFHPLDEGSLLLQAAPFLEFVTKTPCTVFLAYCFTENTAQKTQLIRQNGLGPKLEVSANVEALFVEHKRKMNASDESMSFRSTSRRPSGLSELTSIPENCPVDNYQKISLGWIVAVASPESGDPAFSERRVSVPGGEAIITTVLRPDQSLPLCSFASTLRKDDRIGRLLNDLTQKFNNLLPSIGSLCQQLESNSSMETASSLAKRRKIEVPPSELPQDIVAELDLLRAIQSSIDDASLNQARSANTSGTAAFPLQNTISFASTPDENVGLHENLKKG